MDADLELEMHQIEEVSEFDQIDHEQMVEEDADDIVTTSIDAADNSFAIEGNESIENESENELSDVETQIQESNNVKGDEETVGKKILNSRLQRDRSKEIDARKSFEHLKGNPPFDAYVKSLVSKQVMEEKKKTPTKMTPPRRVIPTGNGGRITNNNLNSNRMLKSPSDTTLYVPALHKVPNNSGTENFVEEKSNQISWTTNQVSIPSNSQLQFTVQQISDFIEGI